MEQQLPMALQVALYTASAAIIVLAAVLVPVLLRFRKQLDRVATAVEGFEAEFIPLARETRAVVDQWRGLSELARRQLLAVDDLVGTVRGWTSKTGRVADAAGGLLLAPVLAFNRTTRVVQTGLTAFLHALWTGRRPPQQKARAS